NPNERKAPAARPPRTPPPPPRETPVEKPAEPAQRPPSTPPPAAASGRLRLVRSHEALAGFPGDALPAIGPPRPSALAGGAGLLLKREDDRPALAAGRFGLGRALVWAVPADDAQVLAWDQWPRLLAQAVRSLLPPADEATAAVVRVAHEARGDVLYVSLPDSA